MQHQMNINYMSLSPAEKLQIIKEMDFREDAPLEHGINCTSRQDIDPVCDCWPGTTSFKAPADVKRYMGEDNEARQAFAEKRAEYENDGIGKHPDSWVAHLENTAPRYNS